MNPTSITLHGSNQTTET